jgi:hypothetical protein
VVIDHRRGIAIIMLLIRALGSSMQSAQSLPWLKSICLTVNVRPSEWPLRRAG